MSVFSKAEYDGRVKAIRDAMQFHSLDAMVVTSIPSARYFCGYEGREEIALLIFDDEMVLVTGKLHIEEQVKLTYGCDVVEKEKTLSRTIADLLNERGVKSAGCEGEIITFTLFTELASQFKGKLLKADGLIEALRELKSDSEIGVILESLKCAETAYLQTRNSMNLVGSTEREVSAKLDYLMKMNGANVISFPVRVSSGENAGVPHRMSDDRVIGFSDPVMFDWGAVVKGYHSDISVTVCPGGMWADLYAVVLKTIEQMEQQIVPGMVCSDVYRITVAVMHEIGGRLVEYEMYGNSVGHGIGLEEHETPHLSKYSANVIRVGQVICFEPSLYLYGKGCIHLESMYRVTTNGLLRLSTLKR